MAGSGPASLEASNHLAETPGRIAPAYEDLDDLPFGDQMIFHTWSAREMKAKRGQVERIGA